MPIQQKESVVKKIVRIVLIVVGVMIGLVLILLAAQQYSRWKYDRETDRLQALEEKPYREDTYGGKTPKETLELFIAAVEKNDFDLASKYFVLSKQEEWKKKLKNGDKENLKNWIALLKKATEGDVLGLNNFQMRVRDDLGKDLLVVDFLKYPSDLWKIQEI